MAEAEILTKDGMKVIIKGEIDEVKHLLEYFKSHQLPAKEINKKPTKRTLANSVTDKVRELIKIGFFSPPRSINEVAEQLSMKGYSVKLSEISPVLLFMVRRGEISREGAAKHYKYTVNHS